MTSQKPPPMVPADCDLQDFRFMPLDVVRLRDSELASSETPEACWAAVLLWSASWHQIPAGSVPNDDKWLAKQAGYVARGRVDPQWARIKDGAMRGFVECSDGRLYHPVVAEKAKESWAAKLRQRWGTECARIKKHNDRHEGANVQKPTFEEWMAAGCPQGQPLFVPRDTPPCPANVPAETPSKRQGEGQGQGDIGSVPDGTDGGQPPAPPEPKTKSPEERAKADLWHAAVAVLAQGGCSNEPMARSFMGKLVKDYTLPVVKEAVDAAVTAQPADAREYLRATCQRLKGERKDPVTVPSDDAAKTSAALAAREAQFRAMQADPAAQARAQAARQALLATRARLPAAAAGALAIAAGAEE